MTAERGTALHVKPGCVKPGRPPALLLKAGLNLVRPLGLAAIPVLVASTDPGEPALVSRHVAGRLILPGPDAPEARTVEVLCEAGACLSAAAGGRVPIFYGNDDTLSFVSRYREELSPYFSFLVNDRDLTAALLDKTAFQRLARTNGLLVPKTLAWDAADADSVASADFPLIVKPKHKFDWYDAAPLSKLFERNGKGRVFATGRELLARPEFVERHETLIVQEYIPGGDEQIFSFHGFAASDGEVLAPFCGRKIRTYPRSVGESCFLELVKDSELAEVGRQIIHVLGFKGPFKMDLKKDARDGRLFLLEINARFNLWHYLGAANGVNVPAAAYEYLVHGRRPAASDYATRWRWIHLTRDFEAYRELRQLGEITFTQWLGSLVSAPKVFDTFSWRDPAPFLLAAARDAARRVLPL